MICFFALVYLLLANFFKLYYLQKSTSSNRIQYHSIIHCVLAFLYTSFLFLIKERKESFDTDYYLLLYTKSNDILYDIAIYHSIGYFLADTFDILLDYTNTKRRIYLLHHGSAIVGLSIIYWGSYIPVYPIWALEMGGIVHHLKNLSEMREIKDNDIFDQILKHKIVYQLFYHVVYLFSRILLTINVYKCLIHISLSRNPLPDLLGLTVVCVLIVQNIIWWFKNVSQHFRV